MQDILAYLILLSAIIFGGAAVLHDGSSGLKYYQVVLGVSVLVGFVILSVAVCMAVFWALARVMS